MDKAKKRIVDREKRAFRVRKAIFGSTERPRLCVRRSLKHISAQIIDDTTGKSIAQVSSAAKGFSAKAGENGKVTKSDVAKTVGEMIAEMAKEKGIQKVVFDRKGYLYHGRIKALAEAARSKGLVF
jgi:large subunit ribosomal protein L18